MSVAFDTLEYAKELEAAGFTPEQAAVQARALARIVDEKLATKQDIAMLQRDIKQLQHDLKELEERLNHNLKELEERLTYRLTVRMGTMLVVAVGVLATLMKIL